MREGGREGGKRPFCARMKPERQGRPGEKEAAIKFIQAAFEYVSISDGKMLSFFMATLSAEGLKPLDPIMR